MRTSCHLLCSPSCFLWKVKLERKPKHLFLICLLYVSMTETASLMDKRCAYVKNGRTKRDKVSHQAMSKPCSFRVGPEAAEYSSCIKRKQWTDGLGTTEGSCRLQGGVQEAVHVCVCVCIQVSLKTLRVLVIKGFWTHHVIQGFW